MIMLYKDLVGSMLEYRLVCYSGITHTLRLESIQYRGIRTALGLIGSTPNNSLGILGVKAPLAERFVYLNLRYLVALWFSIVLTSLGRCIAGCSNVLSLNIVSSESRFASVPGYSFCGGSNGRGTFRGSDIYELDGGSSRGPRAVGGDS
jgi:hypothetical protein